MKLISMTAVLVLSLGLQACTTQSQQNHQQQVVIDKNAVPAQCKAQEEALVQIRKLRASAPDYPSLKYIAKSREEAFLACIENRELVAKQSADWDVDAPDRIIITSS